MGQLRQLQAENGKVLRQLQAENGKVLSNLNGVGDILGYLCVRIYIYIYIYYIYIYELS